MADAASFHAVPWNGGWSVRKAGGKRALRSFTDKTAAWSEARRRARANGSVAYLHGADGRIATKNSYRGTD